MYSRCHIKRRLGWLQLNQTFFWYDTDYKIVGDEVCSTKSVLKRLCHCNMKRRTGDQGQGPANPSHGMTLTIDLYSAGESRVRGVGWGGPTKPFLGMTLTIKNCPVIFTDEVCSEKTCLLKSLSLP